jgi:hypothetical protein
MAGGTRVSSQKRRAEISDRRAAGGARQHDRFIEAARELGADQSEEAFDEALRRIEGTSATSRRAKTEGKKAGSESG